MKKIPDDLRNSITASIEKGYSYRVIARKYSVSIGTVSNIAKANEIYPPEKKNGRPQKHTLSENRILARLISSGEAKTASQAKRIMKNTYGIEASKSTTQRQLKRIGFRAKKKLKKPSLEPRHVSARLIFAKEHVNWSIDDWNNVFWTDETKINIITC